MQDPHTVPNRLAFFLFCTRFIIAHIVPCESKQDEPGILVATLCGQLAVKMREDSY